MESGFCIANLKANISTFKLVTEHPFHAYIHSGSQVRSYWEKKQIKISCTQVEVSFVELCISYTVVTCKLHLVCLSGKGCCKVPF